MRYLNKIVFINSAQIKYSEINLDGNVHFIGTQGVGKSTVLRAILFFYNADTLKLGISKEKKSFTEYYFHYANSYIIYEIIRSEGAYCILAYKSQNKVCFRFFDGQYDRTCFVNSDGKSFESWDGIAHQLDLKNVFYTKRKIDSFEEYRDILYGNNDGKKNEVRRYALMESKEYQNIPRTIQNVFLNSKLEAEFIKQTIIMSLENDIKIDLNNYTHHLRDFETQLNDIKKFRDTRTSSQAIAISKLYIAIKYLEREKIKYAKELAWALNTIKEIEPQLLEKLETEKNKEDLLKSKFTKALETFKNKEKKISGDISIYEDKLKTIKKKQDDYVKLNIEQLILRVSKKPSLEIEKKNLSDEKELLSTQFKELTLKFQAVLKELENQLNDFLNIKKNEKLEIQEAFHKYKDRIKLQYENRINEIKTEHKKDIENARQSFDSNKQVTNDLKIKREGIRHKRFFEEEITSFTKDRKQLEDAIHKSTSEIETLTGKIGLLQKQWEMDERDLQKSFERNKENLDRQIEETKMKIAEIDSNIENSKNSLYGWLTENYPSWENSIGKVIDEKNVLFNTALSPKTTNKDNTTFYGIELDLNEINKTVKTVADYENDKIDFNNRIVCIGESISDLVQKISEDNEKLKKKYQPKIRDKKDSIKENEYLLEQNKSKLDETIVKINDFKSNAEIEQKKSIAEIDNAIAKATEEELKAKQKLDKIEEEIGKLIKAFEKERDKKIELELEKVNDKIVDIEAEIKNRKEENQIRKLEINSQQQTELSKKGADTERLSTIDEKIESIKSELKFIDENRNVVAVYENDKRELFDKVDEFRNRKQLAEKNLEQEETKYNQQKELINKEREVTQSAIKTLTEAIDRIKEDKETFESFSNSECFNSIQEFGSIQEDAQRTEKRVKILIDEIKEIHYDKLNSRLDEIRKIITDFLGKFSEDNIFKFKKQLTDNNSFLKFAEELSDFIEENKISVLEKEVNERFSFIIKTIGKETTDLVSKEGEIQNVITKINRDFVERNFAGVIKKIELMLDISKNEVVQLLKLIKEFNDENTFDLGTANLFSSQDQDSKNKRAIELLKQFVKKIGELKRDYISLSDSFELKFRIEENQNDTGWVEKLSNVGSDGTDVLVKAMINIMLLNVFKEGASKRFKDFQLHCMMDEIGKLHPNNVRGILKFANDRNILLINSSPTENDALAFKHIYKLEKDDKSITKVKRILTQHTTV
jgi:hypothetical protein